MKDFVRFKSPFARKSYDTEIERIQLTKLLKVTEALLCFAYLLSLADGKSYTETIETHVEAKQFISLQMKDAFLYKSEQGIRIFYELIRLQLLKIDLYMF